MKMLIRISRLGGQYSNSCYTILLKTLSNMFYTFLDSKNYEEFQLLVYCMRAIPILYSPNYPSLKPPFFKHLWKLWPENLALLL